MASFLRRSLSPTKKAPTTPLSIGQMVRVASADGKTAQLGIVSIIEGDTVDVEYENGADEADVPLKRVSLPEPFEVDPTGATDTATLGQQAKVLVKLKDFGAAISMYQRAIDLLSPPVQFGTVVLLQTRNPDDYMSGGLVLRPATVSDMADGGATVDLLFEDDDTELEGVDVAHLIPVATSQVGAINQSKLYVEMATMCFKLLPPDFAESVAYATYALHVAKAASAISGDPVDEKEVKQLTFKAHSLRSRAHLLQNHFKAAAADIKSAILINPGDKTARQMAVAIQQRQKKALKSNRKLAREISEWVSNVSERRPSVGILRRDSLTQLKR